MPHPYTLLKFKKEKKRNDDHENNYWIDYPTNSFISVYISMCP